MSKNTIFVVLDVHSAAADKIPDLFPLNPMQLKILFAAISRHHFGRMALDPTIGTCWDA